METTWISPNNTIVDDYSTTIITLCTIHTDINECAANNQGGCTGSCQNSPGSFQCSCSVGFELAADQMTCVGKKRPIVHHMYMHHDGHTD